MKIEYKEYPALVIDILRTGRDPYTLVWSNSDGSDVTDFMQCLRATVDAILDEVNDIPYNEASSNALPSTVTVWGYAMQIPVWVAAGQEMDFLLQSYAEQDYRWRSNDRRFPQYKYEISVWSDK